MRHGKVELLKVELGKGAGSRFVERGREVGWHNTVWDVLAMSIQPPNEDAESAVRYMSLY